MRNREGGYSFEKVKEMKKKTLFVQKVLNRCCMRYSSHIEYVVLRSEIQVWSGGKKVLLDRQSKCEWMSQFCRMSEEFLFLVLCGSNLNLTVIFI